MTQNCSIIAITSISFEDITIAKMQRGTNLTPKFSLVNATD